MDGSPEPTVIARTLKDFNQFIFSGKKSGDSSVGRDSRQKLNFSEAFSDSSSIFEDDSRTSVGRSRKRQIDEMTGLGMKYLLVGWMILHQPGLIPGWRVIFLRGEYHIFSCAENIILYTFVRTDLWMDDETCAQKGKKKIMCGR